MPNRILKDSICTSPTIDDLTEQEENFFYRLIVHCDDYGLMDARESVLRAKLYPLRLHLISDAIIRNLLTRCAEVGLVEVYEVKGRPYLHLLTWGDHQQIRAKRPKYPRPDEGQPVGLIKEDVKSSDINGNHLITLAPVIQSNPIQYESNPIQSESEISHEISAQAPVLSFAQFSEKLRGAPANKAAGTLADAIEAVYSVECKEYARIAKLVNQHHAGVLLGLVFSCVGNWNGVDNPLDYIQATAQGKKNGSNGHAHIRPAVDLPSNHQPPGMPDVIDFERLDKEGNYWEKETKGESQVVPATKRQTDDRPKSTPLTPVSMDDIKLAEDEKDRIAWEKRAART